MKIMLVVAAAVVSLSFITHARMTPPVEERGGDSHQESLLRSSGNDSATPSGGDGESTISQVCKGCRLS